MADQLPSSVDPTTGADWSALQFLQALRVDAARLDASLQEIRAKLDIPSVPAVSNDGITISVTQVWGGGATIVSWETDRTDIKQWQISRDGIDNDGNGPTTDRLGRPPGYPDSPLPQAKSYNLQPSKTYRFRLEGLTVDGPTEPLAVTYTARAADDPGDPLDFELQLTATAISERQIQVDSVFPVSELGWVDLRWERHGAPNHDGTTDDQGSFGGPTPGGAATVTFEGLPPESTHTIAVVALIQDGRKVRKEMEVTTLTVPGGGDGGITLTATPLSARSIQVDWETTRTDITLWTYSAYSVSWGSNAGGESPDPAARSAVLDYLEPETTYNVHLIPTTPTGNLPVLTVQATTPVEDTDGDGIPDDEDSDADGDGNPDHNDVVIED